MNSTQHLPSGATPESPDRGIRRPRGEVLSFAVVTGLGLAAAGVLAAVDPNQPGHYPTCPFLYMSGFYCPGCGSLRALHDVLHGDLAGGFARNPLAMIALPYLVFAWITMGMRAFGLRAPRTTTLPTWVLWTLLGGILVFWVLRNLPGWTFLSPA